VSRIPSGQSPMRVWEYDGLDPTDPWAVRPTMLAAIAAAMRSEVRAEQILALSEEQPEAARRCGWAPPTGPSTPARSP
jgi:hypothetical protein